MLREPSPSTREPVSEAGAPQVRCLSCGGIIGVYEPMLVLTSWGEVRETSVAQLHEMHAEDQCYHPSCYRW